MQFIQLTQWTAPENRGDDSPPVEYFAVPHIQRIARYVDGDPRIYTAILIGNTWSYVIETPEEILRLIRTGGA